MLANIITVAVGELISGCTYKTVTDRSISIKKNEETVVKYYRPTKLKFINNSGGIVYFLPMTDIEKTAYIAGDVSSDLIPVTNNETITIETFKEGEISHILVSGTSGHTTGLSIILFQE